MNCRVVCLLLAVGIAILCTGCNDGNIYYTLQMEEEIEDLSMPDDVTVFDVTKIGSTYYAAAGKIWEADDATVTWDTEHRIAAPHAADLCTALVASPFGTNNTLFGGFISPSGNLGLYESTSAPSFDGQTAVADPDVAGAQIALLTSVDTSGDGSADAIAAACAKRPTGGDVYQFSIVTSSDGNNFDVLLFDTTRSSGEEERQINDLIYSYRLSAWFVTEGAKLYSGPLAGPLSLVTTLESKVTDGEVLYGLFDDGTNIYVSSWDDTEEAECAIYYSSDAVTWKRIVVPQDDDGTYPPLTRFAGPIGTDADILLVGSDGYGYYALDTGATTPTLTRYATTTSDLYYAAVLKLFLDSANSRVFAMTTLGGMWRGAIDGNDIDWNQE